MNSFTFQGQIKQIEAKTTKGGKQFCTFTLVAHEAGYQGATKEITLKMSAFGQSSDNILAAGPDALITVSGKLESREWQGKHYPDFRVLNVEADDFL